ncbi:MAG: exodeoxyribonuclease VII large subunit [Betaproteobacteria bacterium]
MAEFAVPKILTVSEVAARARSAIETGFPLTWVSGEISNFVRAASGHCYFSLKDERAQVRCVMFKHRASLVDVEPGNGMLVEVRATPTIYEPRGDFQLTIDFIRRAGLGAMYEAYTRLRKRLEAEGLLDMARKRALPDFPVTIGIVTSLQAAALQDVLETLRNRWPAAEVVIYPTAVQGGEAPRSIVQAILAASRRAEVEVLIICRGGGSAEDLWAFNDEGVARAIAHCSMPVVSGVGHETDFTIADLVADFRAPTPTGAAVVAVPDRGALARRMDGISSGLARVTRRALDLRIQRLDLAAARLRHPGGRISVQALHARQLAERLARAWSLQEIRRREKLVVFLRRRSHAGPGLEALRLRLDSLGARLVLAGANLEQRWGERVAQVENALRHLDPSSVLHRGYAIVRDRDGRVLTHAADLSHGDRIHVTLSHGRFSALFGNTLDD